MRRLMMLANRGAKAVSATHCSVGPPSYHLDELLDKWFGKMALEKWQEEKGLRQAKLLIGEHQSEAWLVKLRKVDIRQLRLDVGWLTGHCRMNYHLSQMGLRYSADGRWCHVEEKTTEHLLCECQA